MKVRVVENPDKSVRIIYPNPKRREGSETEDSFFQRVCDQTVENDPSLNGLPYFEIDSSMLPSRGQRYAWRMKANQVVIDPTVPVPPHPKQALLDRVASATTIAQLRAVLTEIIGGS